MARSRLWLIGICLAGLALRCVSLDWGLPGAEHLFPFHPDELTNVRAPRTMLVTGDLNPRFFHYGSLYSYLVWLAFLPCQAIGLLQEPVHYFLVARLVVLVLGVATIWLVYRLARVIAGERPALMTALLFAVAPGHVMHSSFATVDIPSTFFAVLCLLFTVTFLRTPARWRLVAAALATGLAAATKYPTGAVGLAAVAAAIAVRGKDPRALALDGAALLAAGAAGFLAGCPYVLLDFASFWRDMSYELFDHSVNGHSGLFSATGNGGWFLLTSNLPYVTGPLVLVLAIPGFWLLRKRSGDLAPLLAFVLPYGLLLAVIQLRFMRYAIVLAPVLCLAAALALDRIGTCTRLRRVTLAAGFLLAALPALVQTACFLRADSRLVAARVARERIPEGARIAVMSHPDWFSAPLSRSNSGRAGERERYLFETLPGWSTQAFAKLESEWFVASEFLWHSSPVAADTLRTLAPRFELVHAYTSFPRALRWIFANPDAPHDWLYPFPEIRIYRGVRAHAGSSPPYSMPKSAGPTK